MRINLAALNSGQIQNIQIDYQTELVSIKIGEEEARVFTHHLYAVSEALFKMRCADLDSKKLQAREVEHIRLVSRELEEVGKAIHQLTIELGRVLVGRDPRVSMRWVRIEDSLPEVGSPVLVKMPGTPHALIATRQGVDVWRFADRVSTEVTHWLPLPEPPQ